MEPTSLPQELWDEIFSYIYDRKDLHSCSLTCQSWCATAKPQLHYNLRISAYSDKKYSNKKYSNKKYSNKKYSNKSKEFQEAYKLDLLPFVKRLNILSDNFTPEGFGVTNFSYFSAFKNLRELGIVGLKVSSFIPDIHRYFGPFAGALQSLALEIPEGSCRQLLYFIGHFKNLQDLRLSEFCPTKDDETTANLNPPYKPPLRGRLSLYKLSGDELVEEMIGLYKKLYFRCVDLFWVQSAAQILDACAETLEILQLSEEVLCQDSERSFG